MILNREIGEKRSARRILQHETSLAYENMKQRFSMMDFVHTSIFVELTNNRKISRIKKVGQKALSFRFKIQN